jgi:hypothetical protein
LRRRPGQGQASVRAVAAAGRYRHPTFAKNLEERTEEVFGHDHADLWRVVFRRKALVAIREEASEFEHEIFARASHIDEVGVNRHTDTAHPQKSRGQNAATNDRPSTDVRRLHANASSESRVQLVHLHEVLECSTNDLVAQAFEPVSAPSSAVIATHS